MTEEWSKRREFLPLVFIVNYYYYYYFKLNRNNVYYKITNY